MSPTTTLDHSSWLFQLIAVAVVIYLAVGLAQPAWVFAKKRSTVAIASALALLLASTAFYLTVSKLRAAKTRPR
ncbi:MAG: hypothetical protein WDN31_04480 [Hyphomicrobium sp.]